MMSLDFIMSTDLKTVAPGDSLATVRTVMHDNRIHHVPVKPTACKRDKSC
jgi:CBS domain-containing protein